MCRPALAFELRLWAAFSRVRCSKHFLLIMRVFFNINKPVPIAFKTKNGKVYGLSNRQRRGSRYINYCLLDDKKAEWNILDKDFSEVEPIYDPKEFSKIFPLLNKNAKEKATEKGIFEPLIEHLFEFGYRGFGIPFPYSKEAVIMTKKLWNCGWDNCGGATQKAFIFFQYYYVFDLARSGYTLCLTEKRYNRLLFEEAYLFSS